MLRGKKVIILGMITVLLIGAVFIAVIAALYEMIIGSLANQQQGNGEITVPIEITGTRTGNDLLLEISGGITIKNIQGKVSAGGKFTAKSKNSKVKMALPTSPKAVFDTFSYMPMFDQSLYDPSYHLDTASPQYKLNKNCKTDSKGFRKKGDAYLVALGTFYGKRDNIGDLYHITFVMGNGRQQTVKAVLGDIKSDKETDANHQFHENGDGTIVEFIMGSRNSENNATINKQFKKLVSIAKATNVTLSGTIKGTEIEITGKINGLPLTASGTIIDGKINASGIYGAAGKGGFVWPTNGKTITSPFGYRDDVQGVGTSNHGGIDIAVPIGTNVYAASGGTVTLAGSYGGYGIAVIINHGNGLVTIYGHCDSTKVSTGQKVRPGQIIALSGNTGNSTGPHLHFEVQQGGKPVNPLNFIQ